MSTETNISALHTEPFTGTAERSTIKDLEDLRERLREEILAWEGGRAIRRSTINELNGLMAVHPMLTRLTTNGTEYSTKLWFEVRGSACPAAS
jgi:hypothetical protein